jgi:hypothetical protein
MSATSRGGKMGAFVSAVLASALEEAERWEIERSRLISSVRVARGRRLDARADALWRALWSSFLQKATNSILQRTRRRSSTKDASSVRA